MLAAFSAASSEKKASLLFAGQTLVCLVCLAFVDLVFSPFPVRRRRENKCNSYLVRNNLSDCEIMQCHLELY